MNRIPVKFHLDNHNNHKGRSASGKVNGESVRIRKRKSLLWWKLTVSVNGCVEMTKRGGASSIETKFKSYKSQYDLE